MPNKKLATPHCKTGVRSWTIFLDHLNEALSKAETAARQAFLNAFKADLESELKGNTELHTQLAEIYARAAHTHWIRAVSPQTGDLAVEESFKRQT